MALVAVQHQVAVEASKARYVLRIDGVRDSRSRARQLRGLLRSTMPMRLPSCCESFSEGKFLLTGRCRSRRGALDGGQSACSMSMC